MYEDDEDCGFEPQLDAVLGEYRAHSVVELARRLNPTDNPNGPHLFVYYGHPVGWLNANDPLEGCRPQDVDSLRLVATKDGREVAGVVVPLWGHVSNDALGAAFEDALDSVRLALA